MDGGDCTPTGPARPRAWGSGSLAPRPGPRAHDPDPASYSPPHRPAAPRTPAAWPCSLAAARGGPRAVPHHPLRRSGDSERFLGAEVTTRRQARARQRDAGSARCEHRAFRVKAENHVTTNAAATSDPARDGGAAGTELLRGERRGRSRQSSFG